jgi:hypothetical protein
MLSAAYVVTQPPPLRRALDEAATSFPPEEARAVIQELQSDQWSVILKTVAGWLAEPFAWIIDWQAVVLGFTLSGVSAWEVILKGLFLLLPVGLIVAGMWCSMGALYTLPFRSGRGGFLFAMLMSWWDAGRSVWFFWAGTIRVGVVLIGWIWNMLRAVGRLLWQTIKGAAASPFALLDWTSRQYFQPGVPWLAFFLIVFWSAIEATIFSFTLRPLLSELLAEMAGYEVNATALSVLLWLFLFPVIAGSFACIQVLNEAIKSRKVGQIISMAFVEFVVAVFEVVFLYRELVDAITPWLAQQGWIMGVWQTMGLAFFGWVGVRGMTWFLFGRYGTPALLAVLSRQTLTRDQQAAEIPMPPSSEVWRAPIAALKAETAWFKQEAREVFELLSLPVLQILAAALNFAVVVITGRPAFTLPFKSLDEVLASTPFAKGSNGHTTSRSSGASAARASASAGVA